MSFDPNRPVIKKRALDALAAAVNKLGEEEMFSAMLCTLVIMAHGHGEGKEDLLWAISESWDSLDAAGPKAVAP